MNRKLLKRILQDLPRHKVQWQQITDIQVEATKLSKFQNGRASTILLEAGGSINLKVMADRHLERYGCELGIDGLTVWSRTPAAIFIHIPTGLKFLLDETASPLPS